MSELGDKRAKPFYTIGLETLVDEEGQYVTYYNFDLLDSGDAEWPWNHGNRFTDPPTAPLVLKVNREDPLAGEFADYVSGPIPMVTAQFRDVLDTCGVSNVDYYDVVIEGADAFDDFPIYYAMNVTGKIMAADDARSEYEDLLDHPGARLFAELVLRADRVKGIDLFLLAENLSTLIVSERVKTACEDAGIYTLHFMELETT